MGSVRSINIGTSRPNPSKDVDSTGIAKQPQDGPVDLYDPGPRNGDGRSGVSGDFIGDVAHHGGTDQAVYAFAREDLDRWQLRLGRELGDGMFGENLTTLGVEVNQARIGERWQVGPDVELAVTSPRIPCATFRSWMEVTGWLKLFTADARPGAYLRVVVPGAVRPGDPIRVLHRPDHDVTVATVFRALTLDRDLLPGLLEAGSDLPDGIAALARARL